MQTGDGLVLRDIHAAAAPPIWPPAPGWWLVIAVVVVLLALVVWWRLRQRSRARAIARLFDDTVAAAQTPAAQVAAISELLRRAARRRDPVADTLDGDDWLHFLDADLKQPVFVAGAGSVLREGAFRREVSQAELDGLRTIARDRFIRWMGANRSVSKRSEVKPVGQQAIVNESASTKS